MTVYNVNLAASESTRQSSYLHVHRQSCFRLHIQTPLILSTKTTLSRVQTHRRYIFPNMRRASVRYESSDERGTINNASASTNVVGRLLSSACMDTILHSNQRFRPSNLTTCAEMMTGMPGGVTCLYLTLSVAVTAGEHGSAKASSRIVARRPPCIVPGKKQKDLDSGSWMILTR